jgi:hypothetical protein
MRPSFWAARVAKISMSGWGAGEGIGIRIFAKPGAFHPKILDKACRWYGAFQDSNLWVILQAKLAIFDLTSEA